MTINGEQPYHRLSLTVSRENDVAVVEPRQRITKEDLNYGCVQSFIDVVYGAVLGYGAYEVGTSLHPVLESPPSKPDWAALLLLAFVTYYLIADAVEARIYNARFPYQTRDRFLADLVVAGCFLFAYMAASGRSIGVLAGIAGTMCGGGIWAIFLENETRSRYQWLWPRILVASHFMGGIALSIAYYLLLRRGHYQLNTHEALLIWVFYGIWDLSLIVIVRRLDVAAAEADLLPIGLLEWIVKRTIKPAWRWFFASAK